MANSDQSEMLVLVSSSERGVMASDKCGPGIIHPEQLPMPACGALRHKPCKIAAWCFLMYGHLCHLDERQANDLL